MVRAQIDCKAGLDALKERYKSIGAKQTAEAVLQEWYAKLYLSSSFYKQLNTSVNDTWLRLYGKPIQESIKEALIDGFGKPMLKLMRYLEFNHSVHCLPNDLSSGLGNLPVDYVYYNGKPNTNEKTTKTLPLTNIRLSGKVSYRKHLSFFTTTKLTASDIFKEGQKELDIFYPEVSLRIEFIKSVKYELIVWEVFILGTYFHQRRNNANLCPIQEAMRQSPLIGYSSYRFAFD